MARSALFGGREGGKEWVEVNVIWRWTSTETRQLLEKEGGEVDVHTFEIDRECFTA